MSDDDFNGQILAEKLAKLNSSQQSIESLSRWCITHRKEAKLIVETWDKIFKSAPREQLVSFLYLANDILQNSRRKGSEFVNEFWKVLPAALKNVCDSGDESGKKAASRLVDIWEERKVFGSRGQNLKDEILGKNPTPSTVSNNKSSNPIKVVKRDSQSLRIKLAVGGLPEKIISAFQSMYDEMVHEEVALNKCKSAISWYKVLKKDIESSSSLGNMVNSELVEKIQEQENKLRNCVSELENAEANRLALVSQLKEALEDQESKLELIHNELQVARGQIEQAMYSKQKLLSSHIVLQPAAPNPHIETSGIVEAKLSSAQLTNASLVPPIHPSTLSSSKLKEEDSKKSMAAVLAAKLAASSSSAQMLTSALSSLAAGEVASMSNGLNSTGSPASLPFGSPEKRLKLEKSASFPEVEHFEGSRPSFFPSVQQNSINVPVGPSNGMQHASQGIQIQASFTQPQPPPSIPPMNPAATQLGQSAAMMVGIMPYGYGTGNLPLPPPSLPQMGFARPVPLPTPQPPPQQFQNQQSQQQQEANIVYYRPPGIGFYGQSHQPATPPVPRQ